MITYRNMSRNFAHSVLHRALSSNSTGLRWRCAGRYHVEIWEFPGVHQGLLRGASRLPVRPQAPVIPEALTGAWIVALRRSASTSSTWPSLLSASAPAVLIAVTLFPSPESGLEITIRWGCMGCWPIFVRRLRYCSLGRHWPFSNGNSGDGAGTCRLSVRICERRGASAAEDPCAVSAPAAAGGAPSLLNPPPTRGGQALPVNQGAEPYPRSLPCSCTTSRTACSRGFNPLRQFELASSLPSREGRRGAAML